MTDTAVLGVATQTVLTGDVVDISTAEAMIAEALLMADEAQERERVALALGLWLMSKRSGGSRTQSSVVGACLLRNTGRQRCAPILCRQRGRQQRGC